MSSRKQKIESLIKARELLYDLAQPKKTPRVPKSVRKMALDALHHFPWTKTDIAIYDGKEFQPLYKRFPVRNGW